VPETGTGRNTGESAGKLGQCVAIMSGFPNMSVGSVRIVERPAGCRQPSLLGRVFTKQGR
jgi:hypothetical protein